MLDSEVLEIVRNVTANEPIFVHGSAGVDRSHRPQQEGPRRQILGV